ncbi:unnamed protein product [Amoebophrya sp. A120]|nr:unnamed protein product [Amoebophrya sp. A120]|eukprot:GSA120T00010599001.1
MPLGRLLLFSIWVASHAFYIYRLLPACRFLPRHCHRNANRVSLMQTLAKSRAVRMELSRLAVPLSLESRSWSKETEESLDKALAGIRLQQGALLGALLRWNPLAFRSDETSSPSFGSYTELDVFREFHLGYDEQDVRTQMTLAGFSPRSWLFLDLPFVLQQNPRFLLMTMTDPAVWNDEHHHKEMLRYWDKWFGRQQRWRESGGRQERPREISDTHVVILEHEDRQRQRESPESAMDLFAVALREALAAAYFVQGRERILDFLSVAMYRIPGTVTVKPRDDAGCSLFTRNYYQTCGVLITERSRQPQYSYPGEEGSGNRTSARLLEIEEPRRAVMGPWPVVHRFFLPPADAVAVQERVKALHIRQGSWRPPLELALPRHRLEVYVGPLRNSNVYTTFVSEDMPDEALCDAPLYGVHVRLIELKTSHSRTPPDDDADGEGRRPTPPPLRSAPEREVHFFPAEDHNLLQKYMRDLDDLSMSRDHALLPGAVSPRGGRPFSLLGDSSGRGWDKHPFDPHPGSGVKFNRWGGLNSRLVEFLLLMQRLMQKELRERGQLPVGWRESLHAWFRLRFGPSADGRYYDYSPDMAFFLGSGSIDVAELLRMQGLTCDNPDFRRVQIAIFYDAYHPSQVVKVGNTTKQQGSFLGIMDTPKFSEPPREETPLLSLHAVVHYWLDAFPPGPEEVEWMLRGGQAHGETNRTNYLLHSFGTSAASAMLMPVKNLDVDEAGKTLFSGNLNFSDPVPNLSSKLFVGMVRGSSTEPPPVGAGAREDHEKNPAHGRVGQEKDKEPSRGRADAGDHQQHSILARPPDPATDSRRGTPEIQNSSGQAQQPLLLNVNATPEDLVHSTTTRIQGLRPSRPPGRRTSKMTSIPTRRENTSNRTNATGGRSTSSGGKNTSNAAACCAGENDNGGENDNVDRGISRRPSSRPSPLRRYLVCARLWLGSSWLRSAWPRAPSGSAVWPRASGMLRRSWSVHGSGFCASARSGESFDSGSSES